MTAAPACVCPESQIPFLYNNRHVDAAHIHTHAHTHSHKHSSQTDAAVWELVSIDTRQHVLYNKPCPQKDCSKPVRESRRKKNTGHTCLFIQFASSISNFSCFTCCYGSPERSHALQISCKGTENTREGQ